MAEPLARVISHGIATGGTTRARRRGPRRPRGGVVPIRAQTHSTRGLQVPRGGREQPHNESSHSGPYARAGRVRDPRVIPHQAPRY